VLNGVLKLSDYFHRDPASKTCHPEMAGDFSARLIAFYFP
jgi:hypothetical protein